MAQSPRDVVDALLRAKPNVERMAVTDSPWGDTLQKWADEEGYPTNENNKPVPAVDYFEFDLAGVGGWFDALPLRGHSETLEETDEWRITRNGAGAALKYWKNKSGTPEHIDFLMTSREVWERDYRPHMLEVDRERLNIEVSKNALARHKEKQRWTHYGHLFIWEQMRRSFGDVCMYESLLLDPGWIRDFNQVNLDFYKSHYAILLEEAGTPDGVWIYEDLGYRNGLACSPQTLAELVFPYYAALTDFFHEYDLPVVFHSCGGIEEALPLMVDAGFDALNPMEVKAGCDVLRFAKNYGDKLAFIGGLDARILESGDKELICSQVIRIVEGMKSMDARYVFGSDHSISTNVKLSSMQYAIDTFREHMYY